MPPGMVEVASAYVPLSRVQKLTDLVILQDNRHFSISTSARDQPFPIRGLIKFVYF
jgi:hypothetical protein